MNCRDVTANRSLEADLERHAQYDALTGLPNRAKFTSMVNQALASEHRGARALLLIDIDDFKTINDSLGHAAGDTMLGTIADRLRTRLRLSDTAARLSADEFAVFIPNPPNAAALSSVAERLVAAFREPFEVEGISVGARLSIGGALAPQAGSNRIDLLKVVDAALYQAKAAGRDRYLISGM